MIQRMDLLVCVVASVATLAGKVARLVYFRFLSNNVVGGLHKS